jgi:hypothetical protein
VLDPVYSKFARRSIRLCLEQRSPFTLWPRLLSAGFVNQAFQIIRRMSHVVLPPAGLLRSIEQGANTFRSIATKSLPEQLTDSPAFRLCSCNHLLRQFGRQGDGELSRRAIHIPTLPWTKSPLTILELNRHRDLPGFSKGRFEFVREDLRNFSQMRCRGAPVRRK